jgi:hypothetical protein
LNNTASRAQQCFRNIKLQRIQIRRYVALMPICYEYVCTSIGIWTTQLWPIPQTPKFALAIPSSTVAQSSPPKPVFITQKTPPIIDFHREIIVFCRIATPPTPYASSIDPAPHFSHA